MAKAATKNAGRGRWARSNHRRVGRNHDAFDRLVLRHLEKLDERSKAAIEKAAEREALRALKQMSASLRAMHKALRKAIDAIDRSAPRA